MGTKDRSIDEIGLSVRSSNVLHRMGVFTVGQMMDCTEEQLMAAPNAGAKTVSEIMKKIRFMEEDMEEEQDRGNPQRDEVVSTVTLDDSAAPLGDLEMLTVRSYNLLHMAGCRTVASAVFLSGEDLDRIPHMDPKSKENILQVCEEYRKTHARAPEAAAVGEEDLMKAVFSPVNRNAVECYVKAAGRPVEELGLSNRSTNQLKRSGRFSLADFFFLTEEELFSIRNMGKGSVAEVLAFRSAWVKKHAAGLMSVIAGDNSVFQPPAPTDDEMRKSILSLYQETPYIGLSLADFTEKLPKQATQEQIKRCVGRLLADRELEYVDFRCYRVYPTFRSVLEQCTSLSERERDILQRRLQGETLDSVGRSLDLSRERVRQVSNRALFGIRQWQNAEKGQSRFDEDYYLPFYVDYSFDRKDAQQWLGLSDDSWNYLALAVTKAGKKELSEALDDRTLGAGLRQKIRNYLNRNKIYVDGRWIPKKRSDLERYVIERFCREDTSFEDFVVLYNHFLEDRHLGDESLLITSKVLMTRRSKLPEESFLLWKQGGVLRAYDVDSRDYKELFTSLGLDTLENVEISTAKLMREYPELLARYDIRDHYELHNLLRKTLPDGSFHQLKIERTPNILFGTFDRDAALFDLLSSHADEQGNLSQADAVKLIEEEYGFDSGVTLSVYLQPLASYYHQGAYSFRQAEMSPAHQEALLSALKEDFYYLDELRQIYKEVAPEADTGEINALNLKRMGFSVYSRHALRNYPSLDAFFRQLLMANDQQDITPLRRRYGQVQMFSQVLTGLRRTLQLVEYERDKLITMRKLEEHGVTHEMILRFREEVYQLVQEGSYFNTHSLCEAGFESDLLELGFSDWFPDNLLIFDERFSYTYALNTIILFKGHQEITVGKLEYSLIQAKGSVDVYDLQTEMEENFGCTIADRLNLIYRAEGSGAYYDRYLDRLYANEALYLRELDDAEEGQQ